MHLKTILVVIIFIISLSTLIFGIMAALGVSIKIDLTTPGPIQGEKRPDLEQVEKQKETTEPSANFRFVY